MFQQIEKNAGLFDLSENVFVVTEEERETIYRPAVSSMISSGEWSLLLDNTGSYNLINTHCSHHLRTQQLIKY